MGFPLSRDDFPDAIEPVTAANYQTLREKLRGSSLRPLDAENNYSRLSGQIAFLTGHEFAHDRQGRPYTRQEWEDVFHKCIGHLNKELMLGFNEEVVDVLTLCYTLLAETPRYGGDPVIGKKEGESTGVHSLHTLVQAQYVYQKALEENPALADDVDFFRNFQLSCVLLAVHDLGEMLGEAGSLAAVAEAGTFAVKDKTEYERAVFNFAVKLAVQTVVDKKSHKAFYKKVDAVRALTNVQNMGSHKTDSQLVAELETHLKEDIKLSRRAQSLFSFLRSGWEMVEEPAKSKFPFLGHLATVCERVQGGRHINRHMIRSQSPVTGSDGKTTFRSTAAFLPGYRIVTNAEYTESKLALLCDAADKTVLRELAIAEQAVAWAYRACIGFIGAADAFFRKPVAKETRLHTDGTPFTPQETASRLAEMQLAARVANYESARLREAAKKSLKDKFNEEALFTGRSAFTRTQAIALYQKAIDTKYLPGFIETGGKKMPEVLIRDLPQSLTGVPALEPGEQKTLDEDVLKLIPPALRVA